MSAHAFTQSVDAKLSMSSAGRLPFHAWSGADSFLICVKISLTVRKLGNQEGDPKYTYGSRPESEGIVIPGLVCHPGFVGIG